MKTFTAHHNTCLFCLCFQNGLSRYASRSERCERLFLDTRSDLLGVADGGLCGTVGLVGVRKVEGMGCEDENDALGLLLSTLGRLSLSHVSYLGSGMLKPFQILCNEVLQWRLKCF